MAKLEFTSLDTVLFSEEDVFFVTIKKNIAQLNDNDGILVWFEDNSTSKPEYWNIERDFDCSDYTSRTNSFFLYSPKTQTDTISLAISLKKGIDLPFSTALTIRCELSSVDEIDKPSTTIYYQSTYNPFSESDGIYTANSNYNIPDSPDGTKQLLRTNPKLSGNIKITVDSNDNVWLNTIDANIELSANKFKKYKVSSNNTYAYDLRKLLDNGNIDPKTLFFMDGQDNSSVKSEYKEQYKTQYWSGSEYLSSLFYDEEFSVFAPLLIDKTLPDFFVIFSSNYITNDNQKDFTHNFKQAIIKNSKIVKVFSMKEGTVIGNYIRGIINSPSYKSTPMSVVFNELPTITYRGVDYKNGVFAEKDVLIDDLVENDSPISFFEKKIIEGFEKNGLISYNLLNLEFLFDDTQSHEYDINRYFGFYVSENELSKFIIDEDSMSDLYPWVPKNKFKIDNSSDVTIYDESGISIIADLHTNDLTKIPSSSLISDLEHIFYIKGKFNLYKIDDSDIIQNRGSGNEIKTAGKLKTSQKRIDLSDITGFSSTKIIAKSELKDNMGFPFHIKNLDKFRDSDSISFIYQKGDKQKEWKVVANSYVVSKGSTLEQEFISNPIDVNQCLGIDSILSYSDYNVGTFVLPDLLDFSIGSTVLLDFGYKAISTTPYSQKTVTLSSGTDVFTVASTDNLYVNQPIYGNGIQPNSYITNINSTTSTITISQNATTSGSSIITFSASIIIKGSHLDKVSDGDEISVKDLINLTLYHFSVNNDTFTISGNTVIPLQSSQSIASIVSTPHNFLVRLSGFKIVNATNSILKETTLISGTNVFTVSSITGISVHQPVFGDGVQQGSYVAAINTMTNAITISKTATTTGFNNITFGSSLKIEGNYGSINFNGSKVTIKESLTELTYQLYLNEDAIDVSTYTILPIENASIISNIISDPNDYSLRFSVDTTDIFKSKSCEIVGVEKDLDYYRTTLSIKDSTKSILNDINNIDDIFVHVYYYKETIYNYFNPEGSTKDYLTSIVNAFNTFDNKNFTVSSTEDSFILRSNFEDGSLYKVKIDLLGNSTESSDILVHNIESIGLEYSKDSSNNPIYKKIINIEYKNPKNRKVFTVPKQYSNNITGEEWVRTSNSNKTLKPYSIQNSITYYLYNENNNVLELELSEPLFPELDNQSNVSFLNLHKNSFGVMSFLPIVDFDFDFFESDYSYLPAEELKKYFYIYYTGDPIPVNNIYRVFCESGVKVSLFAITTDGDKIQVALTNSTDERTISFNTSTNLISIHTIPALYSDIIGDIEVSHFIFENTNPINQANRTYLQNVSSWSLANISGRNESETQESGLVGFEGFGALNDLIEQTELEDIKKFKEENSIERFSNFILSSEYDYLRENFNKHLSDKGRTIPYINKWVIPNSYDVRSNEYRLNLNLVMGDTGFSPDYNIKDKNPIVFTHEWYYLEGIPSWYSPSAVEKDRNYTFSKVNEDDLKSVNFDGFLRAFIRGSHKELYKGGSLNTESKKLYTYVNYDKKTNKSNFFFKGAKFNLNVSNPSNYNNWKFTAVLRPKRKEAFIKGDNLTYTLIENKKWKSLTFVIDAYLPSYIFPDRGLNLLGLYNSESAKQLSVEHGSYDKFILSYSDIQLSGSLIPTFSNTQTDGVSKISINTSLDLRGEINRTGNLSFNDLRLFGYGRRDVDSSLSNIYLQLYGRGIDSINENKVLFNYDPSDNQPGNTPTDGEATAYEFLSSSLRAFYPPIHVDYLLETPSSFLNSSSYYVKGGYKFFEEIFKNISFASIKEIMESGSFSHIIVSENGDVSESNSASGIGFTYILPSIISKKNLVQPYPDADIPSEFLIENVIGYSLGTTDYRFSIMRYGGEFIPKTKNTLYFTASESKKFLDEFGVILKPNTRFFYNHGDFAKIKNQGLHKVSDKKILSLAESEKYTSVYPLLDEIGIDYKDLSVISTNWDYDFYRYYESKRAFSSLAPLKESNEIKAFMGSKLVNTPMTLLVENFSYSTSLDNSKDFWYEINNSTINIHILPFNILLKTLKTDKFRENILTSTLNLRNIELFTEDFFDEYILNNLVKIYRISSVRLFYRGDRKEQELFLNTDEGTRLNLSFTEVSGISVDNRIEDVLIKKDISDLSNPQLSLSIRFEKI
jgi:hypothetical protein